MGGRRYADEQASAALANVQTRPAVAARAAVALNLGAVQIQRGAPDQALPLLERALEGFKAARDAMDQAQAHYNMGAALAKLGRQAEVEPRLKQGDALLQEARGLPAALPPDAEEGGAMRAVSTRAARDARGLTRNVPFTIDPDRLRSLGQAKGTVLSYRLPGKGGGWAIQNVETKAAAEERAFTKSIGFLAGEKVVELQWRVGAEVPTNQIVDTLYKNRVTATTLEGLQWFPLLPTDFAAQLPHLFYYVIPVALGDSYHALGEFEKAEHNDLQAAGYAFINLDIEAAALWRKLAENVFRGGIFFTRTRSSRMH